MSKEHSEQSDASVLSVGMEDYMLLFKLFDAQWSGEQKVYSSVEQALRWLFLDALYNDGKLQMVYQKMPGVGELLSRYDNIFTVNYDTNIDKIASKKVYHLHGSFETLHHEYDPETLKGWAIQTVKGRLHTYIRGKEYLYCNAILGFSGDDKWKKIKQYNNIYESTATKILRDQHPELKMEPYPFAEFESISGELDIVGLNPNNDSHLFQIINSNKQLSEVVYYYHDEKQADKAKAVLLNVHVTPMKVSELWDAV